LPDGMQSVVGQSGARISGGDGQRIRLGRAMLRYDARLVLLDEPFRGLDRQQRSVMLERCRERWRDSTLLCVTHDVAETLGFERVLVIEDGRLVEDGSPDRLRRQPGSAFCRLLEAERAAHEGIWGHPRWRRIQVDTTIAEPEPTRGNTP
ncbi:MAG: ABC transporter ATP-binding protein, partial [Nannocystaceae bacterium]